ncbi:hypothetical protein AYI70_g1543 [Smittium culicis]|uniref:Reverse transcriptase domain-containing protein n=1 Tax=Smittium culicis TaxID=133412 RepID=A0A1R1YC73_9FUNG|nr:hypothetical protein AYI70_g1543 [Smittium culicis]
MPGNSVKIPGILLADDLVLLADSEVGLRENLLILEKWKNDNEISFGISKCGALTVGGAFKQPRTKATNRVSENLGLMPGNSVKIPGILLADDLVLLADSEVGLRENLLILEKWKNDNEISFGISKCGALTVGGAFKQPRTKATSKISFYSQGILVLRRNHQ